MTKVLYQARVSVVKTPDVLAGQRSDSLRKVFFYLYTVSDQDGLFELDALKIAAQTGLSRKTVYKAIAFLQRVRLLFLVEAHTGRSKHSVYKLNWRKRELPNNSTRKSVTPRSIKDLKSTHSKDASASQGVQSVRGTTSLRGKAQHDSPCPRRDTSFYQGSEAERVVLCLGSRFYRGIMRSIRLGLEEWALSESVRDALEGFYGNRIDGASLAYARDLKEKLWALRSEIEALAARGSSARRIISFVAGRIAGVPEKRSKREVLKRTAQLLRDVEQLERRIAGLRRWLGERVTEFKAGLVCARCGYRHSTTEYRSGYRDDGTGALCCFGFARIKLDELHEAHKLAQRRRRDQLCRECGVLLRDGYVEGLCWSCYDFLTTPVFFAIQKEPGVATPGRREIICTRVS